ncbi:MAG: response regulator [Flavobacteriales bacterium]
MEEAATVRILVIDAQELVADGLKRHLNPFPQLEIVGHAYCGEGLLPKLAKLQVDLLLMDVSLPKMDGIDTMRMLHTASPGLRVLAYSALSEIEYVNSMLIEGACGYLVKGGPAEEVVLAVDTVMHGGCYVSQVARANIERGYKHTGKRVDGEYIGLTSREREIIRLIALERTNTEIAAALFIGEETVKTHRKNLMLKLNVRSAAGLVKYAVDRCWV